MSDNKFVFVAQDGIDGEVTVTFHGNVALITMDRGENRFNSSFMDAMQTALDKVESNPDAEVLITTGKGKFYSNGLDLGYLGSQKHRAGREDFGFEFKTKLFHLLTRIVEFPLVTVAAINGHAFAAGGFMVFAHDYRVMNSEKGWLCLNEVHIGRSITPYLQEIVSARLQSGRVYQEAVVFGRRYTGQEAKKDGLVEAISSPQQLMDTAARVGQAVLPKTGFKRQDLHDMKRNVLGRRIRALQDDMGLVKSIL